MNAYHFLKLQKYVFHRLVQDVLHNIQTPTGRHPEHKVLNPDASSLQISVWWYECEKGQLSKVGVNMYVLNTGPNLWYQIWSQYVASIYYLPMSGLNVRCAWKR